VKRFRPAAFLATLLVLAACGSSAPSAVNDDPDPERRGPQGRLAQFVVKCDLSHAAFDDPLVLPWQPGKSHLHLFFGNNEVDSNPGYDDRLLNADTSCEQRRDTASYWAPALLDPTGRAIEPLSLRAYYRPGHGVEPREIVAYPEGLMLIGGDSAAQESQSTDIVAWSCGTGAAREDAPLQCGDSSTLRMIVTFPDCWDGERLTGFGSSAHARYSSVENDGCPDSHPVVLPQSMIGIDYPPVDPTDLSLSSGGIETAHADFWNVWDQAKLESEVANCLNRNLVCGVS
jgi:hypothetical protein